MRYGDGTFMASMGGAFMVGLLWLKWVGQLWQSELLFLGDMLRKQ